MPSGYSRKSIVASETIWLSSVIAKRWKRRASRLGPGGRMIFDAALGDPLGDPREGLAAPVGELHRHDRLLRLRVEVLLGVLDVGARELRVVLEHEQCA